MNWKVTVTAFALGCASLAVPGCAVDADPMDEADAEEAAASQDELTAAQRNLVGAYHGDTGPRQPTFEGLVFSADGSFFADVDTGLFQPASDTVAAATAGTERLRVTSTQPLTLNVAGTAAAPALNWGGPALSVGNMGLYRTAADSLGVTTGGALRLTVNSTGLSVTGAASPAAVRSWSPA